jgi:hypothetical protein
MPTINIDNTEYDLDSLPEKAKQNLQMMRITDQEIQRLQAQLAIHQTARIAFANALKQNLPPPMGDTLPTSALS